MKTASFLALSLAALMVGELVAPLHAESTPSAPQAKAPLSLFKVKEWASGSALEIRLTQGILQALGGLDEASLKAFLVRPENRLMLAQWHVIHCENAVNDGKSAPAKEGDKQLPATLHELIPSADRETLAFLSKLTNNPAWMEQLAYSGECVRPGRAMAIMAALEKKHRGLASERVLRNVATATGLEWARTNGNTDAALARGDFFLRHYKEGRFHKGFKSLPFWQYRILTGCKTDNANGSVESLEWALDNVHLPVDQYPGACWYCNYLSDNLFGDSIHGAYYYSPYDDVYGRNALQRSRDIGGVCGSLSHFGAMAAVANGVPALPAGEPGHCAYIVCVKGKWVPSYSLSWERGLHWQVWNGQHKYSSLHMASELYSPEEEKKTALGNAYRTLGELYAAASNPEKALVSFRASVKAQPLNYLAWTSYADFLKEKMPDRASAWKTIYKEMSTLLAPRYPEMAAELLLGRVHAPMHAACPASADRAECYGAFWKAVKGMGPDRWAVERLCDSQAGSLQDARRSEAEAKLAFYNMALRYTADKAAYAPVILSWGNGVAARMDEAMQKKFLKATLAGLSKGGKGGKGSMSEGERERMLGQALLGAERMRDRSSFQAIGKLLPDKFRQNRLPKWEPFPGKLVSAKGMIYTSSTCQHDYPAEHWGVLEPTGGRFHTGSDKDAWVVVELPKMAYINGVVTIAPNANLWRLKDMRVQYSETGRDDDWHEAGAMPKPAQWQVNRLDLQANPPRARFIRIVRPGGPEVFHLNAIFVYGKDAA